MYCFGMGVFQLLVRLLHFSTGDSNRTRRQAYHGMITGPVIVPVSKVCCHNQSVGILKFILSMG